MWAFGSGLGQKRGPSQRALVPLVASSGKESKGRGVATEAMLQNPMAPGCLHQTSWCSEMFIPIKYQLL